MRNKEIVISNILLIIMIGIMNVTNYFRDKIPHNIYDDLLTIYAVLSVIIVIGFIVVFIRKRS